MIASVWDRQKVETKIRTIILKYIKISLKEYDSKNSLLVQCAGCSFKPKIGTDFIFPSSAPLWIKADFKGHELSPPSHPNLCIHNHLLVKKWGIAVLCIRISFKCSYYKPTTPLQWAWRKVTSWMIGWCLLTAMRIAYLALSNFPKSHWHEECETCNRKKVFYCNSALLQLTREEIKSFALESISLLIIYWKSSTKLVFFVEWLQD